MSAYERIVVPTEGIPDPTTLAVARAVAGPLGVPVVLYSIASVGLVDADEFELSEIAARSGAGIIARVDADDGRPTTERLVEVACEAGTLLCLRTHARGAVADLLTGAVAADVVRTCGSDVIAVGPECAPGLCGRLLMVAVDDGDDGHAGVGALAGALGLVVESVHVPDESPVEELTELSGRHDVAMLAMVTRRPSALARLARPSTVFDVLRHARCPVLVHAEPAR